MKRGPPRIFTMMRGSASATTIRTLTEEDLPTLLGLSSAAGWNQTAEDWRLLLRLEPEGCLGIELDGALVATSTLTCYRDELAWLGMVLTHPEYRRRGLARQLVGAALQLASDRNIRTVKLDATDLGRPLYESFGFRVEQQVERWCAAVPVSETDAAEVKAAPASELPWALDQRAFGVSRPRVLRALAEQHALFVNEGGYAMTRPGAQSAYLGPCVAESIDSARALVNGCLGGQAQSGWYWDLLPANGPAVALAEEFGFVMARRLVRMLKGPDTRGETRLVFALGGLEIG